MNQNNKIICPDCQEEIKTGERVVLVGEIFECQECGTEVEIVALEPFKYRELIEEK
jgi:lysine biosynthesis protein LysW